MQPRASRSAEGAAVVSRAWVLWERMWAPQWAGGWTVVRWSFALVAAGTMAPRVRYISDAYASSDMIFTRHPLYMADWLILTPPTATALWALSMLGLGMLAWGGRLAKPGLLLWLVAGWLFISGEALNTKAYDRLLTWEALVLLCAPIGERDLTNKWRSPAARWMMLIVFCAIYGSTGWLKLLDEPRWRDGTALAYNLVDRNFGLTPVGIWLSGHLWLCKILGWFTLFFEATFPLLVLFRRTNPIVLLLGVGFHIGIWLTMFVGPFSWVSLAMYPILLQPEHARQLYIWGARQATRLPWASAAA